jgi:glc operon protein GlcG
MATQGIVEYGLAIGLADAKRVMAAAEAEAVRNGWLVVIAILDSAGQLVLLERLDHTQYASIEIALGKARTAVHFKRPTKLMQDQVEAGGVNLRLLAAPGLLPMEGGVPLIRGGRIIGGIGVSGVLSPQDAQVAAAGAAVLAEPA